ncbi:MAG: AMP-binding protein [Bacilli bacterium]
MNVHENKLEIDHDLHFEKRTLCEYFESHATTYPDAPFLTYYNETYSYAQIYNEMKALLSFWAKRGIGSQHTVCICLPNCPQFVVTYLAALRMGSRVVLVNPMSKPRELLQQLQETESAVLVYWKKMESTIYDVVMNATLKQIISVQLRTYARGLMKLMISIKESPHEELVFEDDFCFQWEELRNEVVLKNILDLYSLPTIEECALLQYTGGTTGFPKAAILTHYNISTNAQMCGYWLHFLKDESVVLGLLPFFHVYGLTTVLNVAVVRRFHCVIEPRFEKRRAVKLLQKYRPDFFPGAPTMYAAMLQDEALFRNFPQGRTYCISGSAPLHPHIQSKWEELTGGKLVEGYGLTEASPVTHANPLQHGGKPGSIGVTWPLTSCEIRAMSSDRVCDVNEVGELWIRGPQVMRGYYNRKEETAAALIDGWLRTGDLGRVDEDGYFYIVGRKKDTIISGGLNVYPLEVEERLCEHPLVKEAIVVGEPDLYWGEKVVAHIVLVEKSLVSEEELFAWCQKSLASYKCPKRIIWQTELPRTPMGKILRHKLKADRTN